MHELPLFPPWGWRKFAVFAFMPNKGSRNNHRGNLEYCMVQKVGAFSSL